MGWVGGACLSDALPAPGVLGLGWQSLAGRLDGVFARVVFPAPALLFGWQPLGRMEPFPAQATLVGLQLDPQGRGSGSSRLWSDTSRLCLDIESRGRSEHWQSSGYKYNTGNPQPICIPQAILGSVGKKGSIEYIIFLENFSLGLS